MRTSARRFGLAFFVCVLLTALGVSSGMAGAVGETTWISMPENVNGAPLSVEQVTPEMVFVGTEKGIQRSINGGETWTQVYPPEGETANALITDFGFVGNSHREGWAVGEWTSGTTDQTLILFTSDGGLTWTRQDDKVGDNEPRLYGVDGDYEPAPVAYCVGADGLHMYTLDRGQNWIPSWAAAGMTWNDCTVNWNHLTNRISTIMISDTPEIWAIEINDGGLPESVFPSIGGTTESLNGICENGSMNYESVVVGYGGFHLEGSGNGSSFTRRTTLAQSFPHVSYYHSVDDYATDEWYAAGRRRNMITINDTPLIAHTANGGDTWDYISLPDTDIGLSDISILRNTWGIREGWACATNRLIHMASTSADRIYGATRYETAATICEETLPGGLSQVAVLATGRNFADALSAAGLCGLYDAPLLLVGDTLGSALDELDRLNITDVYIVGGTGAVPQVVEDELTGDGINVTRFAGADRYETAALVTDEIVNSDGGPYHTFFVARGDAFPDALAAAPFAYSSTIPILLTRPDSLPAETANRLYGWGKSAYILGGTGAVSAAVQTEIDGLLAGNGGIPAERIAGATRYETAHLAAEKGISEGWAGDSYIGVATGQNFPDALAGGVATGMMYGTMILTPTDSLHPEAEQFISDNATIDTDVRVFGGTDAVSDAVLDEIMTLY